MGPTTLAAIFGNGFRNSRCSGQAPPRGSRSPGLTLDGPISLRVAKGLEVQLVRESDDQSGGKKGRNRLQVLTK